MRRILCSLGLVFAAACGGRLRNVFSAHAGQAASAGIAALPSDSLSAILGTIKGVRLAPETADLVANLWVNYHLLGQAIAEHKLGTDSATVAEIMWPEITERTGTIWHDTLFARRTVFSPRTVDSLYAANDSHALRIVQHILIQVAPNANATDRAKALQKIQGIAAQVRGGADLGKLALTLSGDGGSARDSGYLPPAPRGSYVTSFDSTVWVLAPGQVSGIVTTPYGFHLIRRPPLAQVRDRLHDYMYRRAGFELDSAYLDSISAVKHLKVAGDAPATVRRMLADRAGYQHSSKTLATYDGGKFPASELMKWIDAVPPQMTAQLSAAPDSQLSGFVKRVGQNTLLVAEARAHGAGLSADDWATLVKSYAAGLDSLRGSIGLDDAIVDAAQPLADRERAAGLKVDAYLARAFRREGPLVAIPAPMVTYLRDRFDVNVDPQGIQRAVELALDQKTKSDAAADSAARAHGQLPPSTLPPGMTPPTGAPPAAPQTKR